MPASFARGSKAWGHCQRCGFRYLLNELVADGQISGLRVCEECYDPKHPQERVPPLTDRMALRHATGDMDAAASRELPAEITLAWSEESIIAVDGTADVSYTNATAPIALSVHFVGDSGGLTVSFDGTTATVGAGTAVPGDVTATLRATILDADGKTKTADLPVAVTIEEPVNVQITVLNVSEDPNTDQIFLRSNGSPNGMVPGEDFPPFDLVAPTFQDLFPVWNPGIPLIPEDTNYDEMYIVTGLFGVTTFRAEVELRGLTGGETIDWVVNDGSSAHVVLATFDALGAENQPSVVFTLTADPGEIFGAPRTGEIQVIATVDGTPHTATIYFGFTLAGF
jgi:hypothetical protein